MFWFFCISLNSRNTNLKKSPIHETWMMDQSQGGIKFLKLPKGMTTNTIVRKLIHDSIRVYFSYS